MIYKTIRMQATGEYEEKKSVFIASIKRVNNEEEAKQFISDIRNNYKEARHNVYAYIIGSNKGVQRYSDDGEPQGTGGIPVLEVIKKNDITDTVIVVTRYFGGILLGSAGLCRAYGKAASLAVKNGCVVEKVKGIELEIITDYDLLGKIQYTFNQKGWQIEAINYTDKVSISVICEIDKVTQIETVLFEIAANRFVFLKKKEDVYFQEEGKLFQLEN
jgi:uncharacterized YigZ family protein